jgi:hypothetical protein
MHQDPLDILFIKSLISAMFNNAHLDPNYGLSVAEKESLFNTFAIASDPRDKARGGSYGLFQMSIKTTRGLHVPDYDAAKAAPEDLCVPAINIACCIALTKENMALLRTRGPVTIAEVDTLPWADEVILHLAALHNGGVRYLPSTSKEVKLYANDVFVRYKKYASSGSVTNTKKPPKV